MAPLSPAALVPPSGVAVDGSLTFNPGGGPGGDATTGTRGVGNGARRPLLSKQPGESWG